MIFVMFSVYLTNILTYVVSYIIAIAT